MPAMFVDCCSSSHTHTLRFSAHRPSTSASEGATCSHACRCAVTPHVRHARFITRPLVTRHASTRHTSRVHSSRVSRSLSAARKRKRYASKPCAPSCPTAPPSFSPTDPTARPLQVLCRLTHHSHTSALLFCDALHVLQPTVSISCPALAVVASWPQRVVLVARSSPHGATSL